MFYFRAVPHGPRQRDGRRKTNGVKNEHPSRIILEINVNNIPRPARKGCRRRTVVIRKQRACVISSTSGRVCSLAARTVYIVIMCAMNSESLIRTYALNEKAIRVENGAYVLQGSFKTAFGF